MLRQMDDLLRLYEAGRLDRRQLLGGLAAAATLGWVNPGDAMAPVGREPDLAAGGPRAEEPGRHSAANGPFEEADGTFRGRVLNHVTLAVSDVPRSRAFYQELFGAVPNYEGPDGTDMVVGSGFIGLYRIRSPGYIHHFCVGVDDFDAGAVLDRLKARHPETEPSIRVNRKGEEEVYLTDPDGVRVQISAPDYALAPWRAP